MAEYGIVLAIKDIKGNCALEGHKDAILANSVSFGSSATRTSTGGNLKGARVSVEQTSVSVDILGGKWVAELLNACYIVKKLGDVVITQLGQSVDKNTTAAPTVIQKVTLTNAVVVGVNQGWSAQDSGPRMVSLTFEFDKFLLDIAGKPADFTVRNITAGAK